MEIGKRAVIYLAWGDRHIHEAAMSARSEPLSPYDRFLITDGVSKAPESDLKVIRADFKRKGWHRKTELMDFLPPGYDSYVFLDTDTQILQDIGLGFVKAEKHGLALSPAPRYSIDARQGFIGVMKAEGVEPAGQLQYNTGVIFFKPTEEVSRIFRLWGELAERHQEDFHNDQPLFSLALEMLDYSPYTLSPSYNFRGLGELASGVVRVWHSHHGPPPNLNIIKPPASSTRRVDGARVIYPHVLTTLWKVRNAMRRSFRAVRRSG